MSVWTCDPDRFAQLASEITAAHQRDGGIGTLGEKSIHAVLKYYFDENPDTHERSVGTSVADIVGADGVIEIQTRQFHRLNAKLTALLPECPVTVVYPVIRRKRVTWIDPETGEALRVGTFRKFQTAWAVFPELARILPHITHPHFRLVLAEMEAEDLRLADGYGADRRIRATKVDRLPTRLLAVRQFDVPADYAAFLPAPLPDPLDSAAYAAHCRIPVVQAQAALRVLAQMQLIVPSGRNGRRKQYQLQQSNGKESI